MSNEGHRYGVCVHLPYDKLPVFDRCQAAGITWVRIDLNWDQLEPQKGAFNWDPVKKVVDKAQALGLNVFATLAYAPAWSNGGNARQFPATNSADWAAFVTEVVGRFMGAIKHWGMWNEPNLPGFFAGTLADYVSNVLVAGARAAKAADPACKVLGPDLASTTPKEAPERSWDKWLPAILQNPDAKGAIDIVTHHIYGWPRKSSSFLPWTTMEGSVFRKLDGRPWPWENWPESLNTILQRCGSTDREVWLTETGCEWQGAEGFGLDGQAKAYESFLDCWAKRDWINKVFFYDVLDDPANDMFYGILNTDAGFSPRPEWRLLKLPFGRTHPRPLQGGEYA